MNRSFVLACALWMVIPAAVGAVFAQSPEPSGIEPARADSVSSTPLPLAASRGYRLPRRHPSFEIGVGMHTFAPDLSGLAGAYGDTPSFGLSPVVGPVVEVGLSDAIGILVDAGVVLGGGESDGAHGTIGLVYHVWPSANAGVLPSVSAGVAFASFHGEASGLATDAGATGYYVTGALVCRLGWRETAEFYGGYAGYPRVSRTYPEYGDPEAPTTPVSVDFSGAIFGFRLKLLM